MNVVPNESMRVPLQPLHHRADFLSVLLLSPNICQTSSFTNCLGFWLTKIAYMDLILLASLASIECLLTDLSSIIIDHLHLKDPIKGAFIIYLEGGLSWFWRGSLFFPTMISGGLWKISNKNDIKHRGVPTIFFLKRIWKYAVGCSYNSCLLFNFKKMLVQN